jgi:hypothetical protein
MTQNAWIVFFSLKYHIFQLENVLAQMNEVEKRDSFSVLW